MDILAAGTQAATPALPALLGASDVWAVGRDLGVHYVLEGSIQPSESRIKVKAQLIDVRMGGHIMPDGTCSRIPLQRVVRTLAPSIATFVRDPNRTLCRCVHQGKGFDAATLEAHVAPRLFRDITELNVPNESPKNYCKWIANCGAKVRLR